MLVMQQAARNAQRIGELSLPDVMKGAQHGDTSFPQIRRTAEFVEQCALAAGQVWSQDQMRGTIHEVPVVHPLQVGQVQLRDSRLLPLIAALEVADENQQRKQSRLVPAGSEQCTHLRQWQDLRTG